MAAEYPDSIKPVTRTTCDREKMMTFRWCVDALLNEDTEWLLCWDLVGVRSILAIVLPSYCPQCN